MEALIAVGLAGNVVQFLTCAGSLVQEVSHIRKHSSSRSVPNVVQLCKSLTCQAGSLKTRLKSSAATLREEEQNLLDLATECEDAGKRFLEYLKTWEKTANNGLQSAKTALKFQWNSHKIEEYAHKIDKLRASLPCGSTFAVAAYAQMTMA